MNDQPTTTVANTPQAQLPGAWNLFKPSMHAIGQNFSTLVELLLVPIGIALVGVIAGGVVARSSSGGGTMIIGLAVLLAILGGFAVSPALNLTLIRGARDQKMDFSAAWNAGKPLIWRNAGLGLLVGLMTVIGFILLIVPGLFVVKRYMFSPYFLVDRNLSIGEAMRQSVAASSRPKAAWGLLGVNFTLSLLSYIPLLGLVAAIFSLLYAAAPAVRYVQIQELENGKAQAAPSQHVVSAAPPAAPVQ